MDESLGKREAHKEQTRAALLRAAERLFDEHGFHATTVAAIAEEAGVTQRTFFRYFASKDELASQDMNDWLGTFERVLQSVPQDTPALTALRDAILAALDAPGPVAGWLFPADADGKAGPKTNITRSMNTRVTDIILRSGINLGYPELRLNGRQSAGGLQVMDAFHAHLLARTAVGIVRSAIGVATQRAALSETNAKLEEIRSFVIDGFEFVKHSSR